MFRRDGVVTLVNPGAVAGAYATGDMLGTIQKISKATLDQKGLSFLKQITVLDKDNQKVALDILFFNSAVTMAADNAAFTISSTDLESLIGRVNIATGDYATLQAAGNAEATKQCELLLQAAQGLQDIWMAVIVRGSPTYTNNGLKVKVMLEKL